MVKLDKKVDASTLQETIVAMSIILFVFSVALFVFGNIIRADNMRLDFKGNLILEEYFYKDIPSIDYKGSYEELNQFRVELNYYPYLNNEDLFVMEVNVFGLNGKLIGTQKEILLAKPDLEE